MKYEANAGPPKGDHPTDRAINALPLPQYPIAPPVAAGSVDTGRLEILLTAFRNAETWEDRGAAKESIVTHLNGWGGQQREQGKQEGKASNETLLRASVSEMDAMERERDEARERAEKAEARVKELETKLPVGAGIIGSGPNAKEGDRPCWTPDCGTF